MRKSWESKWAHAVSCWPMVRVPAIIPSPIPMTLAPHPTPHLRSHQSAAHHAFHIYPVHTQGALTPRPPTVTSPRLPPLHPAGRTFLTGFFCQLLPPPTSPSSPHYHLQPCRINTCLSKCKPGPPPLLFSIGVSLSTPLLPVTTSRKPL